jgi:excisionase family DNA binding protein
MARSTMKDTQEVAEPRPRAMGVDDFCDRYDVSRTTAYEQIKAGRLRALKCGKRTIIAEDDAEDWLRRLPAVAPSVAA